jgi:hypothetical protein
MLSVKDDKASAISEFPVLYFLIFSAYLFCLMSLSPYSYVLRMMLPIVFRYNLFLIKYLIFKLLSIYLILFKPKKRVRMIRFLSE